MSNGYGNVNVSPAEDMAAHDARPPELRFLVNYAVSKFSSKHMLREWRNFARGGHDPASLYRMAARGVASVDRKQTLKAYGPTHPEAEPAQRRPRKARA